MRLWFSNGYPLLRKFWSKTYPWLRRISWSWAHSYVSPKMPILGPVPHFKGRPCVVTVNIGIKWWRHQMETFSAVPLWGEFTRQRWIPRTKWRGALVFSLICAWINGWANNREAGDLRRHRAHYDVIVMDYSEVWTKLPPLQTTFSNAFSWINDYFCILIKIHCTLFIGVK